MAEERDVAEILDEALPVEQETPPEEQPEETGEQTGDTPAPTAQPEPKQEKPEEPQTVPYERFKEVNDEVKTLRSDYQRLLTKLEERLNPPPAPQADPEDEMLDPAVKKIKQDNQQLRQVLGQMADQQDLINAKISIKDYDKHASQVEDIRKQFIAKGQYIPRADIYTYLQGKQALSRPAPAPKQEVKPPAEPEKPAPIPATKPAASNKPSPKKPKTLEEEREALKDVVF